MRNIALQFSNASNVFIMDVDFIPSPNLYSTLKETFGNNSSGSIDRETDRQTEH